MSACVQGASHEGSGGSTGSAGGMTGGGAGAPGVGGNGVGTGGNTGGVGGTTGGGGRTGVGGGSGVAGATGTGGRISGDAGTRPDLTGRKALFIVDDPSSIDDGDAMLKSLLEVRGMTVTYAPATGPASLATGYQLVIGSSGASATDFATTFKDVPVPMILFYNPYYVPMGFAAASGAAKGSVASTTQITIIDATSTPLASDFPAGAMLGVINPTRSTQIAWTAIGGSVIKVASISGAPTELIDFAFEKGAAMAVGTAAARRVGLGWKTDALKDLLIDSFKLQDAAVSWTAGAP